MSEMPYVDSIMEPEPPTLSGADEAGQEQLKEVPDQEAEPDHEKEQAEETVHRYKTGDIIELQSGQNYEVIALLGKGGMGQVYKAKNGQTGETVAIKALLESLSDDTAALKRFKLEAETARELDHPNLTKVLEFATTKSGDSVILMEFVEGKTLRQLLDQSGPVIAERAVELFIELAEGFEYAHQKGIIHRDIKPSNVIPSFDDTNRSRILDFGIAKVDTISSRETQDLTRTGGVFGSPYYMSPEQCLGFRLDSRSDIYSLGCLMFEVLTGEPPFAGDNPMQLVVSHINENPRRLDKGIRNTEVGRSLDNVIARCLAKEQDERYQSMEELLQDLKQIQGGQGIPEYVTKRTLKANLSPATVVYSIAFVGLCCLVVGNLPHDMLAKDIWFNIQGGLYLLLCTVGSYFCFNIFNKKRAALAKGKAMLSEWFACIFVFFAGLTAAVLVPFNFAEFFAEKDSIPILSWFTLDHIAVVLFVTLLLSAVFIVLAFIAGLCRFAFRNTEKVTVTKPVSILLVAAMVLVPLLPMAAPRAVAGLTYRLGWAAIRISPDLASSIYDYSFKLDPRNGLPSHVVSIFDQNDKLDKAVDAATRYMNFYAAKDKALHDTLMLERTSLLIRMERYREAMRDAQYLIRFSPEARSAAWAMKANVEARTGLLSAADESIKNALAVDPGYENYAYPVKIGILCRQGKFDEALAEIDRIEKRSNRRIKWSCARGIIYDFLGEEGMAKFCYMESYAEYKYLLKTREELMHGNRKPRRDERLAGAYAAFKLNKIAESEYLLNHGSDFEFPPRKKELMERLFNYSWDLPLKW